MAKKKIISLGFKIDPELNDRIEKRAIEENRNKSNFVVNVLTNYLDEVDRAKRLLEKKP